MYSPQEYKTVIKQAYHKYFVEVIDIWVIPDYDLLIQPFMDKDFGQYCKTHWTQLMFKFEAVAVSEHFPLGCRTTYRRYTRDEAILIRKKEGETCGFIEEYCKIQWFPEATEEVQNKNGEVIQEARPAGFFLLQRLPDERIIRPQGFRAGGFADFHKTLERVRDELPEKNVAEWEEFAETAPDSDDVAEYLVKNPEAM